MKLRNISLNNLKRRKGKVLFLVMGLLIGIATIVTLLSITESMTKDIEDRLDRFGANIVIVPKTENLSLSYGGITVGGVSYETKEFKETDLAKIRSIENNKNLGAIAPKILGAVVVKDKNVLLMGVDMETELNLKTWWILEGARPTGRHELLIGSEVASSLGVFPGEEIELAGENFKISAMLMPTGGPEDGVIVGDLHAIQRVLGKEGKISMVEVMAFCRDCPITEMVLQIADKFPEAKVTALKQAVMSKMQSIEMFKSFSYGIAALVIFVGSLLVFVTMMGAVNERTREIGIFRAIGFRRGHVMQVILLEALIVGFFGGLLGFLSGSGIAWAVIPYIIKEGSFIGINYSLGGMSMLIAISLSLLASLYPAHKGSKLDPSEALRAL